MSLVNIMIESLLFDLLKNGKIKTDHMGFITHVKLKKKWIDASKISVEEFMEMFLNLGYNPNKE